MYRSIARIETERASGYLQRLCKHFAHKLPVHFTPEQGTIPFSPGTCQLAATGTILTLEAKTQNAEDLARVQDVVDKHLLRFAFREPLAIEWRNPSLQEAETVTTHGVSKSTQIKHEAP